MSNPLFAVRWAQDQVENEWIRPAVACRWNNPEGDMAVDDELMREALLERLIGEMTQLAQRATAIDLHLQMVDRNLERLHLSTSHLTVQLDKLVEDVWRR